MEHLPASPHGPIEEIFDGIWFVRGQIRMPMLVPMKIGRAMTIVRGADDGLTLFNSMRLTDAGLKELDALGKITNVVRLAGFHGRDDGFYRDRYGAKVHAVRGMAYRRGLGGGKKLPEIYMEPDVWLEDGATDLPIADARLKVFTTSDPAEALCLIEREGGIVISGDALQHVPEPCEYTNFPAKLMMKKFGFYKPHNVGPGWLQFAHPTRADVQSVLDLDFDHVLPGHGMPVLGGARDKYRPTIEGELKGCH